MNWNILYAIFYFIMSTSAFYRSLLSASTDAIDKKAICAFLIASTCVGWLFFPIIVGFCIGDTFVKKFK